MAQITAWEPNAVAAAVMSSGLRTAAEFTDTLSEPAAIICRQPATSRKPPPTVKGMRSSAAARAARSIVVARSSEVAVMSRNTTSSAPSLS